MSPRGTPLAAVRQGVRSVENVQPTHETPKGSDADVPRAGPLRLATSRTRTSEVFARNPVVWRGRALWPPALSCPSRRLICGFQAISSLRPSPFAALIVCRRFLTSGCCFFPCFRLLLLFLPSSFSALPHSFLLFSFFPAPSLCLRRFLSFRLLCRFLYRGMRVGR